MTHPSAGTHVYQGLPLHVRGLDLRNGAPAPLFGEHTDEVLRERLGLDADELARLRAAGVTAHQPRGARPARPEIAR
jgi:crotonobetainyl-CoA:carnitine CoA-transferase CaiB-like acyl-CoA transferase